MFFEYTSHRGRGVGGIFSSLNRTVYVATKKHVVGNTSVSTPTSGDSVVSKTKTTKQLISEPQASSSKNLGGNENKRKNIASTSKSIPQQKKLKKSESEQDMDSTDECDGANQVKSNIDIFDEIFDDSD